MKQEKPIIISITGPESTGKTTLTNQLTAHLPNARSVLEFAREYLHRKNKQTADDANEIIHMMEMQLVSLKQAARDFHGYIIMDTDDVMYKIWIQEVFKELPPHWNKLHGHFTIDFTLLCAPDLAWAYDPLRVNPNDRDRLFACYELELNSLKRPYAIIQGLAEERLDAALLAIEQRTKTPLV